MTKIIGGYQNTLTNNEDFALTPYLFIVYVNNLKTQIYGLGICWGWFALYIGFAVNPPKALKRFTNHSKNIQTETNTKIKNNMENNTILIKGKTVIMPMEEYEADQSLITSLNNRIISLRQVKEEVKFAEFERLGYQEYGIEMFICPKCGHNTITKTDNYCGKCGIKILH